VTRRALPVFATVFTVVFTVTYLVAVWKNYALFTYDAATGRFAAGVQRPGEGEGVAMYWYGWMATAGLAGLASAVAASFVPERLARKLWSGWSWLVPLCVVLVFSYLLRNYFLR
jgi:hypothetical protein